MTPLRALMADGRWHRIAEPGALLELHNEADLVAGVMPLHVEVVGNRARKADKGHCLLCEAYRKEIARLKASIAALEGRE
jgi:hypothetical protein